MECKLENLSVAYDDLGEGRPIIMLHGWSRDRYDMVSDMESLFGARDGCRRIYLDLPGHGHTLGADWIRNQDQMLDVVTAFIDKLIPGQRFALAGVSAGAYLARGVVYRKLALLDGALLAVPVIAAADAKRTVPVHAVLFEDAAAVSTLTPGEAWMREMAVVQSQTVIEALRQAGPWDRGPGDPAFQARIRDDPATYEFSFDADALPTPCSAPALIVAGRQDSVVGYRDAWKIMENYPRATFAVLDRAGHCLGIEQRNLFHALAAEWLDRVEEYAAL
jgi:pimeloyl-ACP methyl ester carboxylesterase